LAYYRYFQQRVSNGNAPNDTPCKNDDNTPSPPSPSPPPGDDQGGDVSFNLNANSNSNSNSNSNRQLCTESGVSTTFGGVPIQDFLNGAQYGVLDTQLTSTNAYGASVQVTDTHDVFGLKNHFVLGVAFDGAQTQFNAASFIGGLTTDTRAF